MNLRNIYKLVISLPHRTDRLNLVQKELDGWEFEIIPGVVMDNPIYGIAQAHLNCIRRAKELKHNCILIMEDDIVLRNGAKDHLNTSLENLPKDWDILLGGVYENKNLRPFNDHWDQVGEFCGLHFYIVNEKAYDAILAYDFSKNQHIDRWMNKENNLKCYVLKKFIATQRHGYSDNVKMEVDYSDKIQNRRLL